MERFAAATGDSAGIDAETRIGALYGTRSLKREKRAANEPEPA